jgi:hypothetical protein
VLQTTIARNANKQINGSEGRRESWSLMFGFIFAWAAVVLMLANLSKPLLTGVIDVSVFWALFAFFAVVYSLFLGVGFETEKVE